MNGLTRDKVKSLFGVAGLPILGIWELANQYWPRPQFEEGHERNSLHYAKLREESPWWLVKTPYGLIEIGARKRVIEINWLDTGVSASDLTTDSTTIESYLVHAWTELKAAEYLTSLRLRFNAVIV